MVQTEQCKLFHSRNAGCHSSKTISEIFKVHYTGNFKLAILKLSLCLLSAIIFFLSVLQLVIPCHKYTKFYTPKLRLLCSTVQNICYVVMSPKPDHRHRAAILQLSRCHQGNRYNITQNYLLVDFLLPVPSVCSLIKWSGLIRTSYKGGL